jgi:hypothetical protein
VNTSRDEIGFALAQQARIAVNLALSDLSLGTDTHAADPEGAKTIAEALNAGTAFYTVTVGEADGSPTIGVRVRGSREGNPVLFESIWKRRRADG